MNRDQSKSIECRGKVGADDDLFQQRRAVLRAIAAVVGAAGVGAGYWYIARERSTSQVESQQGTQRVPTTQPATWPAVASNDASRKQIETIYRDAILPMLADFDARNAAAVERALGGLHDRIRMHKAGIPQFTREIVSWKTRFGVVGRYSSDVWYNLRHGHRDVTAVSQYVNEKFRRHILSEDALKADVAAVLAQFDQDVQASRNRLYSDLSLPLERIRVAVPLAAPQVDRFREDVARRAARMTSGIALDTVVAGLAAVAGGWVATDVAQAITTRIVTQILSQIGTAMAAEGIEAGGATAGGAAAGAGGGSLGGPLGAIIGLGVGLVIGAIVDWRLSKKFEHKVARQCEGFLDLVEYRLRNGTGDSPGLRRIFLDTIDLTGRVQRDAILAALKETCP